MMQLLSGSIISLVFEQSVIFKGIILLFGQEKEKLKLVSVECYRVYLIMTGVIK